MFGAKVLLSDKLKFREKRAGYMGWKLDILKGGSIGEREKITSSKLTEVNPGTYFSAR